MKSAVQDIESNPLRIYRKSRGWTLDVLARTVGANRNSVHVWETGGSLPNAEASAELAKLDPDLPEALRKWRAG